MIDLHSLLSLYASVVLTVFCTMSEGKTTFFGDDVASGSSDIFTTASHLHFQLRVHLEYLNYSQYYSKSKDPPFPTIHLGLG